MRARKREKQIKQSETKNNSRSQNWYHCAIYWNTKTPLGSFVFCSCSLIGLTTQLRNVVTTMTVRRKLSSKSVWMRFWYIEELERNLCGSFRSYRKQYFVYVMLFKRKHRKTSNFRESSTRKLLCNGNCALTVSSIFIEWRRPYRLKTQKKIWTMIQLQYFFRFICFYF